MVFKAPAAVARACGDNYADLVKRVIGLPGDQLTSKGNTIYVNGKALKQPWSHIEPIVTAIGHVTVPANHYFMMATTSRVRATAGPGGQSRARRSLAKPCFDYGRCHVLVSSKPSGRS